MSSDRKLEVRCYLDEARTTGAPLVLTASLLEGNCVISAQTSEIIPSGQAHYDLTLTNIRDIELWNIDRPKLYRVLVGLSERDRVIDQFETRIGFREAKFTPEGFY